MGDSAHRELNGVPRVCPFPFTERRDDDRGDVGRPDGDDTPERNPASHEPDHVNRAESGVAAAPVSVTGAARSTPPRRRLRRSGHSSTPAGRTQVALAGPAKVYAVPGALARPAGSRRPSSSARPSWRAPYRLRPTGTTARPRPQRTRRREKYDQSCYADDIEHEEDLKHDPRSAALPVDDVHVCCQTNSCRSPSGLARGESRHATTRRNTALCRKQMER